MKLLKKLFSDEIVRRYFVMNTFDGSLTVIGILIALMLGGINEPHIVIISCLGSGIAMGVSGFWGAYLMERAERKYDVREKGVKRTREVIQRNIKDSVMVGLVDGLSPFVVTLILITPFIIAPVMTAYYTSFALSGIIISLLGVFIAKVGRQRVVISVLKMLSAGVAVILIIYLLELIKII